MLQKSGAVIALGVAALLIGGPALAQTSADKPSMKDKVEQKADHVGDKIKTASEEAKTGLSDSWLTAKTKIALFADERVKGRQVHVETRSGVVTLTGKVDSDEAKAAATEISKNVEGVKSVRNTLQVVPPAQRAAVNADDKTIAKNVESKLKQSSQTSKAKVEVNNGVVSLTGEVPSIDASAKASEAARSVAGVRAVRNDLTYGSRSSLK